MSKPDPSPDSISNKLVIREEDKASSQNQESRNTDVEKGDDMLKHMGFNLNKTGADSIGMFEYMHSFTFSCYFVCVEIIVNSHLSNNEQMSATIE